MDVLFHLLMLSLVGPVCALTRMEPAILVCENDAPTN